jgi:hypothetical protein
VRKDPSSSRSIMPRADHLRLLNPAATDFAAVIRTLHLGVWPVQAPDQPLKVELVARVAVSFTRVPAAYDAEQEAPQAMPAGLDVT